MFRDRSDAGKRLAGQLERFRDRNVVLVAIPRGGVVVGAAVAEAIQQPLEIVIPRKIGAPGNEELAVGAIADKDSVFIDKNLQRGLNIADEYVSRAISKELAEIDRRRRMYGRTESMPDVRGKTVLVVDDGLATGSTAIAASMALRAGGAESIVLAVPVAPQETLERMGEYVDETICLETPEVFYAVGQFYESFEQVTDDEVVKLLQEHS